MVGTIEEAAPDGSAPQGRWPDTRRGPDTQVRCTVQIPTALVQSKILYQSELNHILLFQA